MANNAAMKKVLSPISEAKIRENAAKKPDFARTELDKRCFVEATRLEATCSTGNVPVATVYPPAAAAAKPNAMRTRPNPFLLF